MQFKETLWISN